MTCPDCERYKQSASMWRNKAYELGGTPLPWKPEELLRNTYDNVLKAIDEMRPAARVIQDKPATWWLDEFEKVVRNLKEKNT